MAGGAFATGPRITSDHNPLVTPFTNVDKDEPNATDLLNAVIAFLTQQLPVVIDELTGLDFSSPSNLFNSLITMFESGATQFIQSIIGPSGLVAMLDNGLIPFRYFTEGIPAALITSLETPNLLFNGLFFYHELFWTVPNNGWVIDQNTFLGGAPSITAIASSTQQNCPGQLIYVAPGQEVSLSCQIQYTNLISQAVGTTTGPIELGLGMYDLNQNLVSTTRIAQVPVGTSGVSGTTGTAEPIALTGPAVTVPTSGVFYVAPVLMINSTAMGGTVWFGDVDLTKSSLISQNFIDGLDAILKAIFGSWWSSAITGQVSAPAVSDTSHHAQPVSDFPNAASLQANDNVAWDPATTYTDPGGNKSNSIRFTADGRLVQTLGIVIPVQPGQTVTPTAKVSWLGLSYTPSSSPIQLQLIPGVLDPTTNAFTPADAITVGQVSPSAAVSDWVAIPGITDAGSHVSAGVYTVPDSGVNGVQACLTVTHDALAGWVYFAACTNIVAGGFLPSLSDDFRRLQTDSEAASLATQVFLDAIKTANTADAGNIPKWFTDVGVAYNVWVAAETGIAEDELATLGDIIQSALGFNPITALFPPTQVGGVGGLQTLDDTLNSWLTQFSTSIGNALNQDITALENLPGVAQLLNLLGITSSTAQALSASTANTVAYVNNRPIMGGLDDTAESNMAYLTALTPITLSAPTSRIAFVRCGQVDTKGAISFTAEQSTGTPPTGMHVNLFKVDFDNQQLIPVTTTAFVAAQLTLASEAMLFASAGQTPVAQGDVLAVEWQSTDATHGLTLFGQAVSKPNHPVAKLPAFGATRNAGTSAPTVPVPFSALTWSNNNLPYAGLETTTPPAPIFFPEQFPFTAASSTWTPDAWAKYVDWVIVGDGGGGEGELGAATGYGGTAGIWRTLTLQVGVDIAPGTVFTITVGRGGAGGPFFTVGSNGTGTTIRWTDIHGNPQSLAAAGGFGGSHALGTSHNTLGTGLGPGDQNYEGFYYVGGADQYLNYPGNTPGGGGEGGQPFQFGTAGARGAAWAVQRQT